MNDSELFKQHREGSTEAFAELVRRHLGWVYGIARRRLRDSHLAEDVAQAVFVLLHRKGPAFAADGAMIGWLHTVTWRAAEVAARSEVRRQRHESTAAALIAQQTPSDASTDIPWPDLAKILDELIGRLSRADAEAVLLRYYRELSFADVGAELKITPEAARKRVDRAIEKLRRIASEKGIDISSASLSAGISTHLGMKIPAGLTATTTVAATAPAGSAMSLASSTIVKGVFLMTASTKIAMTISIAACLLIGGGAAWLLAQSNPDQSTAAPPATAPATQAAPPLAALPPAARGRGARQLRGQLTKIAGAQLTIDASVGRGVAMPVAIQTTAETRFQVDGGAAKLEDLAPGMTLIIMAGRPGIPDTILATSSGYMATVIKIDGTNLIVQDSAAAERTVATDDKTRISFIGVARQGADGAVNVVQQAGLGKLDDLHAGMSVRISPESSVAKAIQVGPQSTPARGR